MAAQEENLELQQGATWDSAILPPKKIVDPNTGSLADLTGYKGRSHLRKKFTDEVPVAELKVTITVEKDLDGVVTECLVERFYPAYSADNKDTAHIPPGNYYHDLELYTETEDIPPVDDIVRTPLFGVFMVKANATH